MKVVIIGTGNTATVLGRKIYESGHEVVQVAGRNVEAANALASVLNTTAIYNLQHVNTTADIYIISVSDKSIGSVANQLKLNEKIVVHTAAAVSKDVLKECSKNYGSLYPLQTLTKETLDLPDIPVLVDGNNERTTQALMEFSKTWAHSVDVAGDEERLKLHIAAVFVNNFTNHLFTIAKQYSVEEALNFNLLYPLIEETIKKIQDNEPSSMQTGPAVRNDMDTIQKHESVLARHQHASNIYNIMTKNIMAFYNKK